MPRTILTDAHVAALAPRKAPYDIRDGKLCGFMTSGTRMPATR